jgi:large subunit ribosomal protein L24
MEKSRAIVKGVNILKKFVKPSAQQPQGGLVEVEGSIHISNLMVIDPLTNKPRRTGRKRDANGKLQRYFKKHKRD